TAAMIEFLAIGAHDQRHVGHTSEQQGHQAHILGLLSFKKFYHYWRAKRARSRIVPFCAMVTAPPRLGRRHPETGPVRAAGRRRSGIPGRFPPDPVRFSWGLHQGKRTLSPELPILQGLEKVRFPTPQGNRS